MSVVSRVQHHDRAAFLEKPYEERLAEMSEAAQLSVKLLALLKGATNGVALAALYGAHVSFCQMALLQVPQLREGYEQVECSKIQ